MGRIGITKEVVGRNEAEVARKDFQSTLRNSYFTLKTRRVP